MLQNGNRSQRVHRPVAEAGSLSPRSKPARADGRQANYDRSSATGLTAASGTKRLGIGKPVPDDAIPATARNGLLNIFQPTCTNFTLDLVGLCGLMNVKGMFLQILRYVSNLGRYNRSHCVVDTVGFSLRFRSLLETSFRDCVVTY